MALNVLYEDKYVIICEKKANVAVESAKIGQRDMVSEIKNYLMRNENSSYLGVVHRLDQPVEGIICFAKTKEAAANLSKQIAEHKVVKKYLAVLCGEPKNEKGMCTDYLCKDGKANTSRVTSEKEAGAKLAKLSYEVLKKSNDKTIVEINLETGRHHQIRVQMAHMGCPLWGDTKYNPEFMGKRGVSVALCAYKLEFEHPITKEKMKFETTPKNTAFAI